MGVAAGTGTITDEPRVMRQVAPYPDELASLVRGLRYRRHLGWRVWLDDNCQRDHPGVHSGEARGMTLIVQRRGPNSYNLAEVMLVNHYFAVPAATYNRQSWMRWLFDQLGKVDDHERMEDFVLREEEPGGYALADGSHADYLDTRPFAPNHGPGWDPYLVTVERTSEDRRTSFRGEVKPG